MTVEPEVLLNRGGEDNCISQKENRENVTGIDKSRHLYICEAGEGVLSGLDSHGPKEAASSNAHYCSVGTFQFNKCFLEPHPILQQGQVHNLYS